MAAVTVVQRLNEFLHHPGIEAVSVTVGASGDTWISEKFSVVLGGVGTWNDTNVTAALILTFSGKTVTITTAGVSSRNCTLILFGRK